MSEGSSKKLKNRKWWLILTLPAWVYGVFLAVEVVVSLAVGALIKIGVPLNFVETVIFNRSGEGRVRREVVVWRGGDV